jgi:hypothetical protein
MASNAFVLFANALLAQHRRAEEDHACLADDERA